MSRTSSEPLMYVQFTPCVYGVRSFFGKLYVVTTACQHKIILSFFPLSMRLNLCEALSKLKYNKETTSNAFISFLVFLDLFAVKLQKRKLLMNLEKVSFIQSSEGNCLKGSLASVLRNSCPENLSSFNANIYDRVFQYSFVVNSKGGPFS